MSLEKIVVSKQQAERLRGAGWISPTVFIWANIGKVKPNSLEMEFKWEVRNAEWNVMSVKEVLSAPTISELIDELGCVSLQIVGKLWVTSVVIPDPHIFVLAGYADSPIESLVRLFESQSRRK